MNLNLPENPTIQFNDIMIDLETMGEEHDAAICSIAAVEFDLKTGIIGESIYVIVDLQSCLNIGMTVNASTIYFWMQQSEKARNELLKPNMSLHQALSALTGFLQNGDPKQKQLWSRGKRFDLTILTEAYRLCGFKIPWSIRNERDVRTLEMIAPDIKNEVLAGLDNHIAIEDANAQVKYCSLIAQRKIQW